ncbi:putative Ig domain-containing protein [Shinella sp. CPCC 101442]|uniref:putative Ig domain-containing protein n=1 Tax=Shinella sp. CPCC 101442 TaxID=2932265 RepID=UPI0021523CC5|nr:putative Ig domain-containing protein [Shinella sp. CPCC 101442]MCR6500860.1 putative Ig domain-containing protein [Shinella sp. CPCC 101442]
MAIASGLETRVNSYTVSEQSSPRITALSDGGWVVAWMSNVPDGPSWGVYQQAYQADGTPQGSETQVNSYTSGNQYRPRITALSDGGWVVTWVDAGLEGSSQDGSGPGVYQQAYHADGTPRGSETQVNSYTLYSQYDPQITALSDGGWVVTWVSIGQDGPSSGVYQQAYQADGTPQGGETQVNSYTSGDQYDPRITALSDGGWVVTWVSIGQDGSGSGVYQQAYHADGTPQGGETRVNSPAFSGQYHPEITALSDGGWVVTWESNGQDGSGYGVYQQAYHADGTPQGCETQVNSYTSGNQYRPRITALSDGGWVVTWTSNGQDGSGYGVYQQAYQADGSPQGGETQVNSYTTHNQADPQITALSDGGWVVTWVSYGQDGSGSGVYQQAYQADGTPHGSETQVNSYTAGIQYDPRITALSNGGWVVTWTSNRQDGSQLGVYQRTFWLNDGPTVESRIADQPATEDKSFSFTVPASTFADANTLDTLTYSATLEDGDALPGWLTFDPATRTFWGTPANGDVGEISVVVTATDAGGLSASSTFTLTVTNTNDTPTIPVNTTVSTFENASVLIDVLSTAQDVDVGDTLAVTAASVRTGFGSVFIDDDGRLLYDPTTAPNQNIAAGETRTVLIRYTVSDGNGGTKTAYVTMTVNGISPDIFKGTSGNDVLNGSTHDDILYGYAGKDTLDGKTGADKMRGGAGDDTYVVDHTGDTVVERAGEGTDLVKSSLSYTLVSNVENLRLTGTAISGTGNGSANILTGNRADNTLDGKAGADRMIGGKGNDTYVIGSVKDEVVEKAGEGADLVKASVSFALAANVENLTLTGSSKINGTGNTLNNTILGNAGINTLSGGGGNDKLKGYKGNDTLYGGSGADDLYGGSGKDTFVFKSKTNLNTSKTATDTIFDFSQSQKDIIDLSAIDANTRKGGNQAFTFIKSDGFHDKAGELRYEKKASDTYIYGDTDGNGKANFVLHFDDALKLTKADFLL